MKRSLISVLILLGVIIFAVVLSRYHNTGSAKTIGIIQYVHHPLLDEANKGLLVRLEELGLNDGTNFKVENLVAQKDFQTTGQIVQHFVDKGVSLIVAIATPAAQEAASKTTTIPIVFAAITDPVRARLVESTERPGRNLTGTSNRWPFEKQVSLIPQLLPNARRIGAVWNTSEINSQSAIDTLKPLVRGLGCELIDFPVTNTSEVAQAIRTAASRVDCFLMIPDNTALAATDAFVKTAWEIKRPLIGGDINTVKSGSLASYGFDYFELGKVTADMVKEILIDGKKPSDMPVRYPPSARFAINILQSARYGVEIPDSLKARAVVTIQ
jgi:putative tryptophan/tyrosine transport system substrate-binding protein